MGAGLAKQIRAKWPSIYAPYAEICRNKGSQALGTMFPYKTPDNGPVICNCFAQDGYGRDRQYTSYPHLQESLCQVRAYAEGHFKDCSGPKTVYGILNEVFFDCNNNYLHVYICKLPERQKEELK